jgi:hypothetical protein
MAIRQELQAEQMSIYNQNGGYLSKDEIIQSLSAENDMLRKELYGSGYMNQKYMDDCVKFLAENDRLKSDVERLRKAGDKIIHEWSSGHGTDVENFTKSLWIWTVAKQGKSNE